MKILVNKIGNNSVTVQRPGFSPTAMTYTDFFEQEMYEPNKYSYVDSVNFENGVITFYKIDNEYSIQYADEYIIDSGLLSDENFKSMLLSFIEKYDSKKDELNRTLEERLNKKSYFGFQYDSISAGQKFYREYIETGKVPYIYRDEIAIRILHNCQNDPSKITSYISYDSYYGDSISNTVEFPENEKYASASKICAGVSIISLVGTLATLTTGLTIAAAPLALTGITGLGAYHFNKNWHKKQDELNDYHIETIRKELEQRYDYMKPLEISKGK